VRPKQFLSRWYVRRKLCTYIAPTLTLSQNGSKRDSTWPTCLGLPLGVFKMISEPMVRLAQTAHLSCVKISTISKRTLTSFHLCLITYEFRRVRPKQFLSRWYVRRKLCTYIAPTITLSPNGPKRDSIWPTRLGLPSGVSRWFMSLCYVWHKPRTYLASRLTLSPNGLKQASTWASSPRSIIGCVQNYFWAHGMFGANRAPILRQH
jgi:hypothetical protein